MARSLTSLFISALIAMPMLATSMVSAEENSDHSRAKPAVDGINGKLNLGKAIEGTDAWGGTGAIAVPLGHHFGLQLDGGVASADLSFLGDVPVYGGAAHLFWRDPSQGLLGIYGDYVHIDVFRGFGFYSWGGEAAIYRGRFTIDAMIGYEDGELIDGGFTDRARLSFYPTDNVNVHIGHVYAFQQHNLLFGSEWAIGGHGGNAMSISAEGALDDSGEAAITLSLNAYFGQRDKTLIRRHREDDPPGIRLLQILRPQQGQFLGRKINIVDQSGQILGRRIDVFSQNGQFLGRKIDVFSQGGQFLGR